MIANSNKKEKTRCRMILHLPTGDVVLHFADFEDLGHKDLHTKYSFIYFEDSADKLPPEYEAWHEHNIWHGHTSLATPCEMTVHTLDAENNITKTFRYGHTLPERALMAPSAESDESPLVLKAADFRYIGRTEGI